MKGPLLHIISSLDPRGGGPAEVIRQLGPVLERDHGWTSRVVTLDAPDAPWLPDFPIETVALGPARSGYRYAPKLVPWLRAHAAEAAAVIVHGLWQYPGFGTWRALRGTAIPYFVYPHGMLDPWFKRTYPLKHLKKWLYWPWAEFRVLRDARAVLFTCEQERRLARQSFALYGCHERLAPLGIAAPEGDPEAQREAFLAAYPALRGTRLLLFLGRVHEKKGCDLLIRAFAETLRQSPISDHQSPASAPLHVVIAGPCADPAYLASLQALATKELFAFQFPLSAFPISFLPMLTGDLKWGALRAAEAFVLPSHQENFGIAVVEALASGTPVLISDQVNIWREIEADGAGMVEPDDLAGTVRMLKRWLALPVEERPAFRAAATSCFDRHFEATRAGAAFVEALFPKTGDAAGHAATLGLPGTAAGTT